MTTQPAPDIIDTSDIGEPAPTPEDIIRSIQRRCRGPIAPEAKVAIATLLADGLSAEASALASAARRVGCGYDWNEVILTEPFDGQSHETACPNCGTLVRWTSPVFDS